MKTMNRYELIDKVVAEIAKDKGISEGEVGTYDTLLRVADIAVKNCSIPNVVGRSELLPNKCIEGFDDDKFCDHSGECEWCKDIRR